MLILINVNIKYFKYAQMIFCVSSTEGNAYSNFQVRFK